jgi:hypothetical protein
MTKNKKIVLAMALLLIILIGFSTSVHRSSATIYIPTDTGLPDPPDRIAGVLKNVLNWMLGIVGVIAVIGFVVSGFQYITASGNDKIIETAKRNMTYCILGVVVALSGVVIITAIDAALRASTASF